MYNKKPVVVAFTFALILLLSTSFYYLYHSPSVGITPEWDAARRQYRVASAEAWSPLRPGDVIGKIGDLKIGFLHLLTDNIHIESRAHLFSWFEAKREIFVRLTQPTVRFGVVRDGREMEISVVPRKAGISFLANPVFLHLIAGIVFFLIGITVFYKKGLGEQTVVFLGMCLAIMLIFVTNSTSIMSEIIFEPRYHDFINIANIFALPAGNAILLHFTLLLPYKRRLLETSPWLVPLFYAVCIAIVASLQIPAINILIAVLAVSTMVSVIYAYFSEKRPVERQQMKWVLAGFVFGLGPWVLVCAIPMIIMGHRLVNDTIPAAFIILIPLFMAFAIWKYRLLDIDAFLEGTFTYIVTILILGIADLALLGLLNSRLSRFHAVDGAFVSLIFVVSLYAFVRDRISLLVRRLFRRVALPVADIMALFNSRAKGLPPAGVISAFIGVVREVFQPKLLMMVERGDEKADTILAVMKDRKGLVNLWQAPQFSFLLAEQYYLSVAFSGEHEVNTVVLLGALTNGRFYSGRDLAALNALFLQADTMRENAILYEQNISECNARLAEEQKHLSEREAIMKDLHDGIGGIASNIHLLAQTALTSPSAGDQRNTLCTISELSKEGLFEVESFLQSLDAAEGSTVGTLISEVHHVGKTMVAPHGISYRMTGHCANGDIKLGSACYLNVLRIYREALTNVIKHSRAVSVTVLTDLTDHLFTLTVEDDGIGCLPETSRGRGIKNMETRAKSIGGSIAVTRTGHGVSVRLLVPIF